MLRAGLTKGTNFCQSGVDGMHIVEPRPHLADVLNDEVRRVILLKLSLVFKRIVQLGKRHTAALKPAVQHFVDARKCLAINRKDNIIYPWAVVIIQRHAAQFLELRIRANHLDGTAVALPHRHGRRPKAVTAQIPVGRLLNVLGKAAVLEVVRKPIDMLILLQHQWLLPLDVEKPAGDGPVHDALLRARIKRVFVANVLNLPHRALFLQVFGDELIIVPHLQACVIAIGVVAVIIDDVEGANAVALGELKVVLTISRRDVHDARTRLMRHEIRRVNSVDFVILWPGRARIERLVCLTYQFAAGEFAQYLVIKRLVLFVLQSAPQGFLGDDQLFAIHQHLTVRHIWVDGQHQVGWERPWRGRPGEEESVITILICQQFFQNKWFLLCHKMPFVCDCFVQHCTNILSDISHGRFARF